MKDMKDAFDVDLNKPFSEMLENIVHEMEKNGSNHFVATSHVCHADGSVPDGLIPYMVLTIHMMTIEEIRKAEELIASGPPEEAH